MIKKSLSIIVITYNNFDELFRTLNSLSPYFSLYNVVVINGGKCAKTKSLLDSNPLITSISEPDEGISDAFNKGIAVSSENAITFLNSGDVMLDNNFYEDAIQKIESSDFVFGDIDYDHVDNGVYTKEVNRRWPLASFNHQALVYKKNLIASHLFDKTFFYAMDYEQVMRCLKDHAIYSYSEHKSIKMFSGGASHNHPFKTIYACYKAIAKNRYYDIKTIYYVGVHTLKIVVRALLPESAVKLVLKFKYKS